MRVGYGAQDLGLESDGVAMLVSCLGRLPFALGSSGAAMRCQQCNPKASNKVQCVLGFEELVWTCSPIHVGGRPVPLRGSVEGIFGWAGSEAV